MSITKSIAFTITCTRCHAMEDKPRVIVAGEDNPLLPGISEWRGWTEVHEWSGNGGSSLIWHLCPNCSNDFRTFIEGTLPEEKAKNG